MPVLDTELFDRVVSLLVPFMGTEDERRAELLPVVQGTPVNNRIQWEGSPRDFTVQLVGLLSYDQLLVVLKRLTVGEEQRAEITEICAEIKQEAAKRPRPPPPPPPPIGSLTKKLVLAAGFLGALVAVLSQIPPAVDAASKACRALRICGGTLSCDDLLRLTAEELDKLAKEEWEKCAKP